jgi:AcrR family transcriptional regulator
MEAGKVQSQVREPGPRSARTRAALLAAAQTLLAERPIGSVSIDEIVQAAGVAKGSFYNHFTDKDALAAAVRGNIRETLELAVGKIIEGISDPAQKVARAISVYVAYVLAERERALVLQQLSVGLAAIDSPLNEQLLHEIAEGLRARRFVAPSVEAGVLFVLGVAHIALLRIVEEPDRGRTIPICQQLIALALRGLGVPLDEAEAITAIAIHELVEESSSSRFIADGV